MIVMVLIGMPGCGKSTLARQFCVESAGTFEHISSGAIAAQLSEHDPQTQQALQLGHYAPEAAIRMEVMARIERASVQGKNVLLEGFPRKLEQVIVLEKGLKRPPLYVQVTCPAYVCLQRIQERGREHDEPDAIASRFEAFYKDTAPMLQVLADGGNFCELDNGQDVHEALSALKMRSVGQSMGSIK